MNRMKLALLAAAAFLILGGISGGFGLFSQANPKVQNAGPMGEIFTPKKNLSFLEQIRPAPGDIYDLEATAGKLFGQITNENWPQAEQSFADLKEIWQNTKLALGGNDKNKNSFQKSDTTLDLLAKSITLKNTSESCENLDKFMANASEISQTYKLSPAASIINIGNAVRNVGFYVKEENWEKASSKFSSLENVWNQSKTTMEQFGILGELTKTHFIINQMKDAVDAEDKDAFMRLSSDINESLNKIRNFFYGK